MIKILAIGNSFSQDATAYLYDIAKQGGFDSKVVNLYIGGCSLAMHWNNAANNLPDYSYELNGKSTGKNISAGDALLEEQWDIITMQQASHDSGIEDTYFPYLKDLSEYCRKYCPGAKQMLHETWAYETDCTRGAFKRYNNDQIQMYTALKKAYTSAAEAMNLKLIPSGDVIQALRATGAFDYANGGQSLCRDGFHMDLTYGRFAVAATWYESI